MNKMFLATALLFTSLYSMEQRQSKVTLGDFLAPAVRNYERRQLKKIYELTHKKNKTTQDNLKIVKAYASLITFAPYNSDYKAKKYSFETRMIKNNEKLTKHEKLEKLLAVNTEYWHALPMDSQECEAIQNTISKLESDWALTVSIKQSSNPEELKKALAILEKQSEKLK